MPAAPTPFPASACLPPYDAVARKWCDLALRRRAHYVELYRTGHWTRYYDKEQFFLQLRSAFVNAEAWAKLAGIELADNDFELQTSA
jgi:hypothetical protein